MKWRWVVERGSIRLERVGLGGDVFALHWRALAKDDCAALFRCLARRWWRGGDVI